MRHQLLQEAFFDPLTLWPTGEGNGNPVSILTWKILWTEKPGRLYSPCGCRESSTPWPKVELSESSWPAREAAGGWMDRSEWVGQGPQGPTAHVPPLFAVSCS